jgi:hypothetical protein
MAAALRLIHSHFRSPDRARRSIPVDAMDDDVLICDYIREQKAFREEFWAVKKAIQEDGADVRAGVVCKFTSQHHLGPCPYCGVDGRNPTSLMLSVEEVCDSRRYHLGFRCERPKGHPLSADMCEYHYAHTPGGVEAWIDPNSAGMWMPKL